MHNKTWNIIKTIFLALYSLLDNINFPIKDIDDVNIGPASDNGTLSLKHACMFLAKPNHFTFWYIFHWNASIPHSRSLLV